VTVGVVVLLCRLVVLEYRILKLGWLLLERAAAIRAVSVRS
jgi:hypothetical protein